MTSPWVLLLTDDPQLVATVDRLARAAGVVAGRSRSPGAGPPALVVVGFDRLAGSPPPAAPDGVPLVLAASGEPAESQWRAALAVPAEQVLLLPRGDDALLARLRRLAGAGSPPRRALTVAVAGGCGGAGASVLAAAIARVAAGLRRTVLVEIDRLGGGVDLLLGAEDEPGLRWPDLASVRGRLLPGTVIDALPVVDRVRVLSWDRAGPATDLPAEACAAVLAAAAVECGVVVLDLPRRLDEAAVVAARSADLGLVVVPTGVRAAAAARRVVADLQAHLPDLRLVVRGPAAAGLRPPVVAEALGLPLAGVLRPEPGLRAGLDRGEPPGVRRRGPLAVLGRQLLATELAGRPERRWAS